MNNSIRDNDFFAYCTDVYQRSILFMDVMRRRGNDMVMMTSENSSTVLTFEIEKILDGANFNPPINYWLARVLPLADHPTDINKRPYVIQDPRAGRGPGIAGFKKDSEIGAALKHGHPVYFIGFDAEPIGEQSYEDIIRGQVKFYQEVARLHPHAPKLCAIGNCAAGYLTMFSAMQEPELFGPLLIAGSPLSYWNGERGRNPMRYIGGMLGGSWMVSLLGDIGGGRFDGTNLVMNFNVLNFDNFLWGKQYDLFANVDRDSERFLQFERWLGSFGELNRSEIKWIVDKFFIGNQLTTGMLTTSDGIKLDPRGINSPIVTFISDGDNISPPAQSAGWIADLYQDVDEIIARGKTIVYCLNHKVGHLALFTGSKVAKRENKLFVENMDTIDLLPPGLYELILETPEGAEDGSPLHARYVARTIEDIKNLGYNSDEDDRAFATVNKFSQALDGFYESFIHPLFRMYHNPQIARIAKDLQPLRWNYWLFSEKYNPAMKVFSTLAEQVRASRKSVSEDNPWLIWQDTQAKFIASYLHNLQNLRDNLMEQAFFDLWGNQAVQKYWNTHTGVPRYTPSLTQLERDKLMSNYNQQVLKKVSVNSRLAAIFRVVALLLVGRHEIKASSAAVLINWAKKHNPQISNDELRQVISSQVMVVWYDKDIALDELRKFVMSKVEAEQLVLAVEDILSQIGDVPARMVVALHELAQKLNIID